MKATTKQLKKTAIKTSLAAVGLSLCSLSSSSIYASGNPSDPVNNDGNGNLVQAIQQLGVEINALATAGANALSDAVYQFDQNLPGFVQANTTNASLQPELVTNTTTQTLADIKSSINVYPQQIIPPTQAAPNQILAMTYGVPASDTLYSPKDPQVAVFNSNPQAMPDNDDYFAADSLLGPDGYTSDQQTAAQFYISYLTQSYIPLGSTLNLQPLATVDFKTFQNFQRTNSVYQNYQAGVRSYMAMTSPAISNLNQLMAERTVQTGLGTQVGLTVPSSNGPPKPVADASPLQVQEFIATRRVSNAQWYKDMAAASPATVQRETLFVLAEVEAQLLQLHADNERMLTTMSALMLTASLSQKNQLQVQESSLNNAISTVAGNSNAANNPNNAASFSPPNKGLPGSQ